MSGMKSTAEVIDLTRRFPTQEEIENATEAMTALANARTENGVLVVRGDDGKDDGKSVRLAPAISELMIGLLSHVGNGDMVTLAPTDAMLTTQQAADILNVSRPHLSKLLKEGKIPFISVGSHRRVMYEDLMLYKERRDASRIKALDELARLGQEFDAS